jgi:hypothetical protein
MAAVVLVLACGSTDLIALFFLGIVAMVYIIDTMVRPSQKIAEDLENNRRVCIAFGLGRPCL